MSHLSQLALFFAAAFVLAITPGPGIFYVAARTLAGGRAEGMASTFGTGLGGLVHVIAGSVGVSAIVLASAELFTALKFVGAIYLVWIGFRTFQSARRETDAELAGDSVTISVGTRRGFREGIFVEATNPKTAAFFLAFIPQFVDLTWGHVALQIRRPRLDIGRAQHLCGLRGCPHSQPYSGERNRAAQLDPPSQRVFWRRDDRTRRRPRSDKAPRNLTARFLNWSAIA